MNQVQRGLRALLCALVAVGIALPASVARADPSPQEVEKQLEQANDKLEHIIEDYNKLTESVKATQAAVDDLNTKLAPMQAKMDAARVDVTKVATTAYKTGGHLANAGVMLSAGSPSTLINQVESMNRVAKLRQRDMATYTKSKTDYEAEKDRLARLLADQKKQIADIDAKRGTIEAEVKRLKDLDQRLQQQAAASGTSRPSSTSSAPAAAAPTGNSKGEIAVRYAYAQLGKSYVFNTAGPDTFDCSGLSMAAWKAAGVTLPHNAAEQYKKIQHISASQLRKGDLVFSNDFGHVQIYIDNNQVIHAPNSNEKVKVSTLNTSKANGYGRPG